MINTNGRARGNERVPDPSPEQVEKWASQGLTRKQMAIKFGISMTYFNQKVAQSRDLIRAELRGKLKFYE